MGIIGRVFSIIVLVLAIFALIFNFLLFKQRKELLDRGDKLADAVRKVAITLDKDSGAKVADRLQTKRLELNPSRDPGAGENIKKTLHHSAYNDSLDASRSGEKMGENLLRVLQPFVKQGEVTIAQRDSLGLTLQRVAENLQLPDWRERFKQDGFDSLKNYMKKDKEITDMTAKIAARKNALIAAIDKVAKSIGKPLPKEFFENVNKLDAADSGAGIDQVVSEIEALKKRGDYFVNQIFQFAGIMELSTPSSRDQLTAGDYKSTLVAILGGMRERLDELEKVKAAIVEAKSTLTQTRSEIAKVEQACEKTSEQIAANTQLRDKLKKIIFGTPSGQVDEPEEVKSIVDQLTGEIIGIDRKFDFVVINLGSKNLVSRRLAGGKWQTLNPIAIPDAGELYVARGDRYIGKIKVVKVNEKTAAAAILPGAQGGDMRIGDQVFFISKPEAAAVAKPAPKTAEAVAPPTAAGTTEETGI